jgi:tellurite resistance protein
MLLREDLLAIGKRNVERGQELVYRQRAVVRARRQAGLETEINEDVLRLFERLLDKFEDDFARLTPTETANGNAGSVEPKAEPEGQTALEDD